MTPPPAPRPIGTEARPPVASLLAFLAAALIAGLGSFRQIFENDTGWHLALGRVWAREGLRSENALSWTAPHYHWFPTSWLYDRLLFAAYDHFGIGGAQAFTFLLMLVVLGCLALAIRLRNPEASLGALVALSLLLFPRLSVRPHVATWAVIAWTLAACELGRARNWWWRLTAIPMIAIGINLHAGAALGTGILGLYSIEALWRHRRWLREIAICIGGVLALFATPDVAANVHSLFQHLDLNDVLVLSEYRPPDWKVTPAFFILLPVVAVIGWRTRQFVNLAISATLAVLAFTHGRRFVFEFYLVSTPILAVGALLWSRSRGLLYVGALCILGVASVAPDFPNLRFGLKFDERANPVRAARFIQAQGLGGRYFNSYHDGGYLALMLPSDPIYMDSRPFAYPRDFLDAELRVEHSPRAFRQHLRDQGITWAVTGSYGRTLTGYRLLDSPDWALVYWDEVNEIYLRRDVPEYADKIARLEFKHFVPSIPPTQSVEAALTAPDVTPAFLDAYSAELDRFAEYTHDAFWVRLARCLIAVKRTGKPAETVCGSK